MDIFESFVMYFCIAFALVLVYVFFSDKGESLADEFDNARDDAMARGILGENDE